ncbi:hypothetical protein [Falsiroseomonas sp.]|uniref:hypothetical protein n=1 Tax=Falsiroseomonas sp. TaxID=2870721 RepID=UPI0027356C63|nr:hypothetical protein [Falsiroseomonas sp.]MDP3415425.1 hypothetical protein [Falsiroseomonas sp.]
MREARWFWGEAGLAMRSLVSVQGGAIAAGVILVAMPAVGGEILLASPGSGDES